MRTDIIQALRDEKMTSEEWFVIDRAESIDEARLLLDDFRSQRQLLQDIVKRLRELAQPYTGASDTVQALLNDAARLLESKESHIALLRGQVRGLEHRVDSAEKIR